MTGATGRVGAALVSALRSVGADVVEWRRPEYDLDDPFAAPRLVARDRPSLVYHAAAWTDVDGCARQPEVARRRNSDAVAELAAACVTAGTGLVYVSTNEVFAGDRTDGRGYAEDDEPRPANPYGMSKLGGEIAVAGAYAAARARAWIIRSSWIFGAPGADFPTKVLAAVDRLSPGEPLPMVSDEVGRPTAAADLAAALVRLPLVAPEGTYHLANAGTASRFDFARDVLERCRPGARLRAIRLADFERPSTPPLWGVLDTARAEALGISLRPWQESLAGYLDSICGA